MSAAATGASSTKRSRSSMKSTSSFLAFMLTLHMRLPLTLSLHFIVEWHRGRLEITAQAVRRSDPGARCVSEVCKLRNFMATGLVILFFFGQEPAYEILSDDSIRIGTSDDCNLRLRSSSLPKNAANAVLLELSRTNGSYH